MAADGDNSASVRDFLLSTLVSLDPSLTQTVDERVLELYLLRTAEMRRRRLRESTDRARRLRQYIRRRKAFVVSSLAGVLNLVNSTGRNIWTKDRPMEGGNFWQAARHFNEDEWKTQFRVTRATFNHLIDILRPAIERRKTHIRQPIDTWRRLAIALYWYAQAGEYRRISENFAVGVATVCVILKQVTTAIVDLLHHKFVSLPSGENLDATIKAFKDRGYPQCAGAIGTTHIPIAAPRDKPEDYINSKGWHSVILQAVVDHNLSFTDVYAGWPGSNSSATILSSSDLFLKAEDRPDGCLFPREKSIMSDGVEIPVHLVGDTSFPLKPWLMKGYSQEHQLSPEQRTFTQALNSTRSVVHSAFDRLKGRWRCLLQRCDMDVANMPRVVAACCILHNICELLGDDFFPEWDVEGVRRGFVQPKVVSYDGDAYCSSEVIRDTLTYNLEEILQEPNVSLPSFSGFTPKSEF